MGRNYHGYREMSYRWLEVWYMQSKFFIADHFSYAFVINLIRTFELSCQWEIVWWIKKVENGKSKNIASAGNRTRVNYLEGSYAHPYTTDALLKKRSFIFVNISYLLMGIVSKKSVESNSIERSKVDVVSFDVESLLYQCADRRCRTGHVAKTRERSRTCWQHYTWHRHRLPTSWISFWNLRISNLERG